jgi:uncharacterized protein with ParB-like and HNH nuclease domain
MKASETKLQDIIEGTKQYIVPLFQRPYSWKKDEWQVLWDDIAEICTTDNPRPHFMGSIVTIPATSVPEGVTKYLLIDGQQRLTTVFILLTALRDRAKESEDEELAAEIDNTILVNPYKKGLEYYKLQPTQLDREAFHQIIKANQQNKPIETSGIWECYQFFAKKIRQSPLEFDKIKKVICSNLSVVSVILTTDDDPYLVFESLNAKGRPLTQADLIRNYFFMRIDTDNQQSVYNQYWEPMQIILGENLTEFIRHYLTKSGVAVKQSEIYFEIKDRIHKSDALLYLQDLHKFAEYYAKLLNPDREEKETVRKYLHRINRLDVGTVYPFLLNCYNEWKQNLITEAEFLTVLKIIENYIIRRFVCNVQTRGLDRIFASLYAQVSKETNLASDNFVGRLKLALQNQRYPKDIEFRDRLRDVKLYGNNRSEKGKLILESIEESFNHKEQVPFDKLSIEHIMPKTITDWWKDHLGEDWGITYDLLLNSLGNLTLTAYNSEVSNAPFWVKQKEFQNSHLELNKYFQDKQSWQREDMETRGEHLADIILQIWSYFGDESGQKSKSMREKGSKPTRLHVFGEEYNVKNWRDVLEKTMNSINDNIDSDQFQNIIEHFPRFVGWDETVFRSKRKLKNGAFIELHLSSDDIKNFCRKAIEMAELSTDQWQVEEISRE